MLHSRSYILSDTVLLAVCLLGCTSRAAAPTKLPNVLWGQDTANLFVTLQLRCAERTHLNFTVDSFTFQVVSCGTHLVRAEAHH